MGKFYITTAIPYVNAAPHLGHVLEFVQTDAIARYQKLRGKEVALVTGADENSLKNVQAAEKLGITVEALCEKNSAIFEDMARKVGLSFTSFQRTSDREKHWPGVQKIWELCEKSGDIYKKKYRGLYCVGCEAFYEPEELVGGVCPEHKTKPEEIEEENYFFRLSKYQKELERLIETGELKVLPETRKNEVLSFIRGGLNDFSISRSMARAKGWGVPVPGDDSQLEYVWFDALGTYITGIGYGTDEKTFAKFWPADAHVIGKGILRFHAVYWPAMLLSAGLPLPKMVFVHGYITVEGQKMSKSLGNIVDPNYLIDKYGIDPLRYCLLSAVPTFEDGDFSERTLAEMNNNELLANIGNLVNRTLVFTQREFAGRVPQPEFCADDKKFMEEQNARLAEVGTLLEKVQLKEALHLAMHCGKEANAYFQRNEPWKAAKEDRAKCAASIYVLLHQVKDLAIVLEPFIPNTSAAIFKQLNIAPRKWDDIGKLSLPVGHELGKPEIIFRKLEQKEIEALAQKFSGKQVLDGKKTAPNAAGGAHAPSATGAKPAAGAAPAKASTKPAAAPVEPVPASALDLEVGKIIAIRRHPNAEKLYIETVQMGDGERQIVSGLVPYYKEEELVGKNIVLVRNLKPALLRGIESKGMLLAVEKDGKLEVISPTHANPGDKIALEGAAQSPLPEITIDQFLTVKFEVKDFFALANGKKLAVSGAPVKTANVAEGKVR
ncbi:MAG: methionine--tRNA ligase [Candidatus Micrarchaeota archaeon]|nr:methionine--tRNA ligase [Candidatus Micrarchaeota archaeon]